MAASKAMLMVHETDPAKDIFDAVGDLSKIELLGNRVLIGIYERPAKTKSGIILADTTRQEDSYQGKAALCLKCGPTAFKTDKNFDFHGQQVVPGDWVSIWVSDGRKVVVNGKLCRVIEDHLIGMKIPFPDCVY